MRFFYLFIIIFSFGILKAQNFKQIASYAFESGLGIKAEINAPSQGEIKSIIDFNASEGLAPAIGKYIPYKNELQNNWNYHFSSGLFFSQITLKSKGAKALSVFLNQIHIGENEQFLIFNKNFQKVFGPFNLKNLYNQKQMQTPPLMGDEISILFLSPQGNLSYSKLGIEEIGYFFENTENEGTLKAGNLGASGPCEVNVNCDENNNFRNQQRSIVHIYSNRNGIIGDCSGTLINNALQDEKPYILTAFHCGEVTSNVLADSMSFTRWVFMFNYETPTCIFNGTSDSAFDNDFVTGSWVRAGSYDNGGDNGSDFLLLELLNPVPADFNAYFAGWDRRNIAPQSGVCLHHPSGDVKKVSTLIAPATSGKYSNRENSHWIVYWKETANGHGVTERGSSGSALFNQDGNLVGVLTGGFASCSRPNDEDFYGKFSLSWDSMGTSDWIQLKPWLDPNSSNVEIQNGKTQLLTNSKIVNNNLFKIYPNPGRDLIYIESELEIKQIEILDINGKSVLNINNYYSLAGINTMNLNAGIYFLKIQSEEGFAIKKWVKLD